MTRQKVFLVTFWDKVTVFLEGEESPYLMMMHELKIMNMYVQDKIRQHFPIFEHNSSNGKVFKGEFRREREVEGSTAIPQPPPPPLPPPSLSGI